MKRWLRGAVMVMAAGCLSPVDELTPRVDGGPGGGRIPIITEIRSDPTWKITASAFGSWNTDPNFDDSAWGQAVLQIPQGGMSNGASIWDAATPGAGSRMVFMRKTFTVTGTVESALLTAACNDDMEVWVNGSPLLSEADGVTTYRRDNDVLALLVPGTNLIAASCRDVVGPEHSFHGWLIYKSY